MPELLGNVTVVAVEFYRVRRTGGSATKKVTATPTVSRLTDVEGRGFIDLEQESATPDATTGFGRLLLVATNDAQVAESFGWTIQLEGETGTKTVQVPIPTGTPRTVTVGSDTYPAVYLTDLATFTAPSGSTGGGGSTDLSNYFTKTETGTQIGNAITAHTGAADPHPQYALDAQGLPTGGTVGQVVTKTGPADFAAGWQTPASGGSSSGAANRALYFAMIGA